MKKFFKNIGFTFGTKSSDIKPSEIVISENDALTQKLNNNVYLFDSPAHTNSSFYVITIPLSNRDLFELRRYIWNENRYDLYFLAEDQESDFFTTLYYAKTDPRETEIKIKSFKGDKNHEEELETIKKWKFDSGAFWMSYANFLDTIKKRQRIDRKLIEQLKQLKNRLQNELQKTVQEPGKIVQALIDRTLFIKFLEDNHIINSFFYNYHFKNRSNDIDFGYKTLLKEHDIENINKLFEQINKIFNNILFETPSIKDSYLTYNVLNLIYEAIRMHDWNSGQLSLFDFRFDVIPIEFISHIYEVFSEDNQRDEGIYYTPKKLAHLIIDDTITSPGRVLDPSCGSGIFLVLAFRKLLKNNPAKSNDICKKIEHKNRLLKDSIYGIEKKNPAWRLAIFSLYLEILKGLPAKKIKEFIKQKLKSNSNFKIFPYDLSVNIINHNALETEEVNMPHRGEFFDYIVGNPPYFEIKSHNEEINFINSYSTEIDGKRIKASEVIGYKQISQAFMLKIKDWSKPETKFGFVLNSSNFYNEKSNQFQKFFFEYYQTEKFYELSRVKEILFLKSKESVVVVIFNNKKIENSVVNYYPVDMGIFSEIFDLLIIQEDKKIKFIQRDLLNEKIMLREYSAGNQFDLLFIDKVRNRSSKLSRHIIRNKNKYYIHEGLKIVGEKAISKYYNIDKDKWKRLNREEQIKLFSDFRNEFTSEVRTELFNTKYIEPQNISAFNIYSQAAFMGNVSKFERPRNQDIFIGDKILWNRTGNNLRACYTKEKIYFNFDIHVIKIKDRKLNYLFTAILNSYIVNYYLNIVARKRLTNAFPKISNDDLLNIPIPKNLDEDLVAEISEMSKKLTKGKLKYKGEIKEKLNDLIFDLYELNILEIIRIKEFFSNKKEIINEDLEDYKTALYETLEFYFKDKPIIEYYQGKNLPLGLLVTAIYFNKAEHKQPTPKKRLQYVINEVLKTTDEKFLAMREKVYGNNCIYIIKNNHFQNWTTTKAFEDGKEILKKFIR